MENNHIRYLPLLDKNKIIKSFYSLEKKDLEKKKNIFFIMAGGFGKRLLPFTKKIPNSNLRYWLIIFVMETFSIIIGEFNDLSYRANAVCRS